MKRFQVFNASAGSGKTYTLVLEYLSICLTKLHQSPAGFKHILAITFTKAAAKEMRERALHFLNQLSQGPEAGKSNQNLFSSFRDRTNLSDNELQQRAVKLLQDMLHNYGLIGFSTIDAFTTRLAKPFSEALGFAPNYEVSLDVEATLETVVERVLAQIPEDPSLQYIIDQWIESQIAQEQKTNNLKKNLIALAKEVIEVKNAFYIKKLLQADGLNKASAWLKKLQHQNQQCLEEGVAAAQIFQKFLKEQGIEEGHLVQKSNNKIGQRAQWAEEKELEKISFTNTLLKKLDPENPVFAKGSPHGEAEENAFRVALSQWVSKTKALQGQLAVNKAMLDHLVLLQLAARLESELQSYSKAHQVVLLDQINKQIESVLADNPMAFIYERLGVRYRYFLIDEFQDTSVLQWQNMLPLVAEVLSQPEGEIILVGDAKQAIYSWRGGEMAQIVNFPEIKPDPYPSKNADIARILKLEHQSKPLDTNYRSAREIVAYTNAFLTWAAKFLPNPYDNYYEQGQQKPNKSNAGRLEVHFTETSNEEEPNDDALKPEEKFLLASIEKALDHGVLEADIHILVRNNKDITEISNLLETNGFTCQSERSDSLLAAAQIKPMVTALDYFLLPEKEAYAALLLSQLQNWNPTHFALSDTWPRYFSIENKRAQLQQREWENFLQSHEKFKTSSIYAWMLGLAELFKIPLKDRLLQQFLTYCLDFQQKHGSWFAQFRNHLKEQEKELNISSEAGNAIRISTVHKAKGLSLHTVIIPNLSWHKTTSDIFWTETPSEASFAEDFPTMLLSLNKSKKELPIFETIGEAQDLSQLLDTLNLYYVAFTRAAQNLIVRSPNLSGTAKKTGIDPNNATHILTQWLHQSYNPTNASEHVAISGSWEASEKATQNTTENLSAPQVIYDLPLAPEQQKEEALRGAALHFCFAQFSSNLNLHAWKTVCINKNPTAFPLNDTLLDNLYEQLQAWSQELWPQGTHTTWIEREFVFEGEVIRPDRVDVAEGKVVVSDLKTGKPESAHEKQIKMYLRCLESLTQLPATGALLYSDTNQATVIHGS